MKRLLISFVAFFLFAVASPISAATLTSGTLIKASGSTVYYYAENGTRYVFPTEKTYKSWYADFSTVRTITDAELAAISIGGNVTYRPGTRMVKVTTDPKVYAVQGKELRWVTSEAVAAQLFGSNWAAQIDDIPDAFFVNYTLGANITNASDLSVNAVRDAAATIQRVIDGVTVTENTDEYSYEICSHATSDAQVLVRSSCFFDACGFTFFDLSGNTLGTTSGDGSASGELAARAQFIKEDCRPITSVEFDSYISSSE